MTSTRIRSKSIIFKNAIAVANILELSMANATLLRYFLENTNVDLSKRTFVASETVEGVTNPEFLELYSVRKGDLGWGFDTDGCLSIYGTKAFDNNSQRRSGMSRAVELGLRMRIECVQGELVEGSG